jgi:hypothetical protein
MGAAKHLKNKWVRAKIESFMLLTDCNGATIPELTSP